MKKGWFWTAFVSMMLAITLTLIIDLAVVTREMRVMPWFWCLTIAQFTGIFVVCFALSCYLLLKKGKRQTIVVGIVLTMLWVAVAAGYVCWNSASSDAQYMTLDSGKKALYEGRRVMLLVPHQDDDINVLGGVMEEYVKYGSEVFVVFSTNGDYHDLALERLQEAIDVMEFIGIPEDHVIFLGYGDNWDPAGPHVYNAESGMTIRSAIGRTETYGLENHPAYRQGALYTTDNFLMDIESVILEYRPDILYCVDYDSHIEHRALMLAFDKAVGRILKQQKEYRPLVLKGYAYNTAWKAEEDFCAPNLLATQNIFAEPYNQQPAVYRWEERIRLPVHAEGLARSLIHADPYKMLRMYSSQGAGAMADCIVNSDKVFWQRSTESLCYDADIKTSSGSAALLNDFMLFDSLNLQAKSLDGVWIPNDEDIKKEICVEFPESRYIDRIVLYDHPDPEKNVLNAVVSFEDGTIVETGPLDPGGASSEILIKKAEVSSFTVSLKTVQGDAGITEVEAYDAPNKTDFPFIKLMDDTGNFAYDYWIDPSGEQTFSVYTSGDVPMVMDENYELVCNGEHLTAVWQDNQIVIKCPVGESGTIILSTLDGKISDTVYVRNPNVLTRVWKMFWFHTERVIIELDPYLRHKNTVAYRVITKLPQKLESIFG